MVVSRRDFFGLVGAGVAGLLVPGAAQACGRRRGCVIYSPPAVPWLPTEASPGRVIRPRLAVGPVTISFPDPTELASGQIQGNGLFFAWGTTASGYVVDGSGSGLQLWTTDGTGGTGGVLPGSSVTMLSTVGVNPWIFRCTAPVSNQFYLKIGYRNPPDATLYFITPPYPGPFTCIGF